MNKRGIVLIICYMVIAVLTILGAAFLIRSISERSIASKYFDSTQAFWLAEAGVSDELVRMEANNWVPVDIALKSFGPGQYSVERVCVDDDLDGICEAWKIFAHGFLPSQALCRVERTIELSMPLYAGVLYVVGDIDISGGSYSIQGDITYGGTIYPPLTYPLDPARIDGTVTYDPSITELDDLKFNDLRTLSQSQDNYYDAARIADVNKGDDSYPASFWFSPGVPNVVFLEGAPLTLKGNDTVHGFFVVGGEAIYDATMNGTVSVDGCIYTKGDFTVLGGGGTMNVTGGIWVGQNATLKGGITLEYEADYMKGVQDLGMNETKPRITWRDVPGSS